MGRTRSRNTLMTISRPTPIDIKMIRVVYVTIMRWLLREGDDI